MEIKRYLLPKDCNVYKANLHAHTTFSDGHYTPAQLKEIYAERGYHIIAFSDHRVLVPHNELRSHDFLPITATEIDMHLPVSEFTDTYHGSHIPQYHINFFSKDPNRTEFPEYTDRFEVSYAQDLITRASADGFLVQLNHPRWSYETSDHYLPLQHLWGMEIYNHGSQQTLFDGWGDYEYESACRSFYYDGKPLLVPTASDDNHNHHPLEDPNSDSFGGWTMIYAKNLDYDSVFNAMENKDLYATTGPVISELYLDAEDRVHIRCSPAHAIALLTDSREYACVRSWKDDLTEAILPLPKKVPPNWFRLEVHSCQNNRFGKAMTRAYHKTEFC